MRNKLLRGCGTAKRVYVAGEPDMPPLLYL